ncbi:MAG: hypothetical protein IPL32_01480 [Chloracidobacterium sp.]|nr:hypothetical protein [Chloracidobacterium sp.]
MLLAAMALMAGVVMAGQRSSDNVWEQTDKALLQPRGIDNSRLPSAYETFRLNKAALKALLNQAPEEFSGRAPVILSLPMPDGSFGRFQIEHSLIVERGLLKNYPELGETYRGFGIDDPTAFVRFDFLPSGFHSMIFSTNGTVMVDPYAQGDTDNYISYFKNDAQRPSNGFECEVKDETGFDAVTRLNKELESFEFLSRPTANAPAPEVTSGTQLRTYRLALAANNEYCSAVGGNTVAGCLAAEVLIMNRVNGVYEKDLAMRMVIIANNNLIVYAGDNLTCPVPGGSTACTSANDPYGNGTEALGQNTPNLNTVIGTANYDIGHVFTTGSGGVANLGVPCGASKGGGTTGLPNPVGDPFAIDYVAHEMGHQWGANHTFNSTAGGCGGGNRSAGSAYEVGSGITIMAYAGLCAPQDLANNSIDTFHVKSLEVIVAYSQTGQGNTCAVTTASGNTPPTVTGPGNFNIPKLTPFSLTATATDPDAGDSITYDWQEYDLGPAPTTTLNSDQDGQARPIFRPFLPTASGTRTFPRLTNILNNANVPPTSTGGFLTGEILPSITRTMTFQVVARDNHPGTGGINTATSLVNVDGNSGPFTVTSPNTAVSFVGNTFQTVTWDVANTSSAPVNAANVRISMSTDGGNTFPTVLAASTANDGSQDVLIPNTPSTTARIKVEAVGNIFFDISNTNFTVTAGSGNTPTPTATSTGSSTPTNTATPTATATSTPCGAWVAGPPANPAGYAVPGAVGSDGKFYIAGGQSADATPIISNQFQRFDPTTNTWSSLAPLPVAISQGVMGAGTGKIFVAGGFTGGTTVLNTLSIYDIATNTWSSGANMPGIVEAGGGAVVNGKFYVMGGDDFNNALSTNFIYDIATNVWTTGAVVPSGRTNTYATVANGLIYLYGGLTGTQFTATDTLLRYDPVANSWTTIGSAGTAARGNYGGISPYGTGQLLIVSGANTAFAADNTTRIFNIGAGTFSAGPNMISPRAGHAQGTLPDGRVIVADGLSASGTVISGVELIGACSTSTPTNTPTNTPTSGPTNTSTNTPTATATATNTPTGAPSASPSCSPSVLFDNGPLVTNPTGGVGGAPLSALQTGLGLNILGFGSTTTAPGNTLADDFVVPAGGWTINTVTLYGYQTGSATSPSTFNTARVQIWNGVPGAVGSTVVFGDLTTNRFASSAWSGAYRATDAAPTGATRPIMATIANVGTTLPAGTYWLEFQLGGTGASGPFVPPVSILGQVNKPGSNAVQGTIGAPTTYAAVIDTGTALAAQDIPFILNGGGACGTPTATSTSTPTATSTNTPTNTPTGAASPTATGTPPVTVSLPNVSASPGSTITIPITVGDTTGRGIISYDLNIDYNPAVLQPAGGLACTGNACFDVTGTLSSAMSITPNATFNGHFIISAFQAANLAGAGTLINLRFTVVGANGTSSPLTFADYTDPNQIFHTGFTWNEGDPPAFTTNGSVTVGAAGSPTNTATATPTGTPVGQVFANSAAMCTTLGTQADLYPSTITVTGGPTQIQTVRVTLFGVQHQFPDNMDFLLVGPAGQKFVLMADAGGALPQASPGVNLTFDDAAGQVLPDSGPLTTGSFEPTTWEPGQGVFPAPAPPAPYNEPGSTVGGIGTQTLFGNFGNTNSNGTWSLYMRDDAGLLSRVNAITGCVNGGWQLQFIQATAASASISGRVATADGAGIRNAKIVVSGGSLEQPLVVTTGSFGYYSVEGLITGQTYIVTVISNRYSFSNPTQVVSLVDNIVDANFTADPQE